VAILIDASVLIASERGALQLRSAIQAEEVYANSVVTAGELLHGVHRPQGGGLRTDRLSWRAFLQHSTQCQST